MATPLRHHLQLDANGLGKCSVPMWSGRVPAGFCDRDAYGKQVRPGVYCPGLACPNHGGPLAPDAGEGEI